MAKLSDKSIPFPEIEDGEDYSDCYKRQITVIGAMQKKSDAIDYNNPKADLTGAILSWQVADGYALYVVTSNSPLSLAHIPLADAWQIESETIRGVNRKTVLSQLSLLASFRKSFDRIK